MAGEDIKELIGAFLEYRNLLTPVQAGLQDFIGTYDNMRNNIDKLSEAFSGDIRANLESIYNNLSEQAGKAADLSSRIERFASITEKYTSEVSKMLRLMGNVEAKLASVAEIETKAEEQIGRLDSILEEKRANYNLRELEKTLANYNSNVQKISEFINRDVVTNLEGSKKKLDEIAVGMDGVLKAHKDEKINLEELLNNYAATGGLLKKIAERGEVNEVYIFDVLDRWAESRKVKTKK